MMIQQRPHTHAVSELACSIHSDITELRPQRHLHVCIVSRRAKISKVVTRNRGDDSTASGVTVFLIHGVGGSIDVWRSQFDSLLVPAVAKIVAVDLIGHGQSSAPRHHEAYQFEAIALDVTALFTQFRSMNNIIIGHSYGYIFFHSIIILFIYCHLILYILYFAFIVNKCITFACYWHVSFCELQVQLFSCNF